jgi:hypothetical protein
MKSSNSNLSAEVKKRKFDCIFEIVVKSHNVYWVRVNKEFGGVWWCILRTGQRQSQAETQDYLILSWLFSKKVKPVEKEVSFEEIWWVQ